MDPEEPEPDLEPFSEADRKKYCEYSVERDLPTPWKYRCYDEPIQNPQREMDFGNPMLGDDGLLNCNDSDNPHVCFDDAFASCIGAKIEQGIPTVEGDPVYTGAYISDDCKIHAIYDNREDRWSSLADRKITESKCSEILLEENMMVISNCNGQRIFEFYGENVFCDAESTLVDGICTPYCNEGTEYVDGVCKVIAIVHSSSSHYVNTSPFYQSLLMFSLFLWPYFISGAAIFVVLAKTPRYKKSTRIAVTLSGSAVIIWFLIMMFIGIWPQIGD